MQLKPTPCDGTQTPRCETGTFHSAATGTFETATGGTFIPLYATQYIDWDKKADIKAQLKVQIILTLAKHKYPPATRDEVFKAIFEQAENFKKNKSVTTHKTIRPYSSVIDMNGYLLAAEE